MRRSPFPSSRRHLRWVGVLTLALLSAGCHTGRLRPLEPLPHSAAAALRERCYEVFPARPWEAVHVIEVTLPMSHETALLGAVRAAPRGDEFRSVLMTQEGLVLFDASAAAGRIDVHRAVPPFDREGFGEGMVADIRLVLFAPTTNPAEVGRDVMGVPTCRWLEGPETIEVRLASMETELRRLDGHDRELRSAHLHGIDDCGFAETIELSAPGKLGYDLRMVLVQRSSDACGAETDEGEPADQVAHD